MVSSELPVAGFQHESNKRSFLAKIQLLEAPKLTCTYLQLVPAEQQELSLFRVKWWNLQSSIFFELAQNM